MRIVHVTHELPPYELAGTAIYTWHIAKAQARHHHVSVFARLQDPHIEPYRVHDEQRDGLNIRFFNRADLEWAPLDRSYRDPRVRELFSEFLDETRPDVVHFQHIVGLGLDVLEEVRDRGITSVMTLHDFWAMCPMGQRMCYTDYQICDPIDFRKCGPCVFGAGWKDPDPGLDERPVPMGEESLVETFHARFRERYTATPGMFARKPRAAMHAAVETAAERFWGHAGARGHGHAGRRSSNPFVTRFQALQEALACVDLLITPSAFLRDEFIAKFDVAPSRIIHSANGMDFAYVERLPKTPSPRLRFGFVGSIIRTKGVHVLLDGFLKAAAQRDDIELHVHGAPNRWSGEYLESLKQSGSACDRAFFHGRFDNRQIGKVLQNIDVLVLPSIWFENAPLTLNEAAMSGTPVLVSDRGGMLEFVKANSYGRTFTLGDADDLGRQMVELAAARELVPALAGQPPRIKPVPENAEELVEIYDALQRGTWKTPTQGPARADTRVTSLQKP